MMTIEYLHIDLITKKIKHIPYTDDELDGEEHVIEVDIPLKNPLFRVQIILVVDWELSVGGHYIDDNFFHYRATDKKRLSANDIRTTHYQLPKNFTLTQTPYKEGN